LNNLNLTTAIKIHEMHYGIYTWPLITGGIDL